MEGVPAVGGGGGGGGFLRQVCALTVFGGGGEGGGKWVEERGDSFGWGWERGGVLRTILQGFIFRVFSMGGGVYVTGFHFFITRKNLPERERRDEAMI